MVATPGCRLNATIYHCKQINNNRLIVIYVLFKNPMAIAYMYIYIYNVRV